MAPNYLKDMIQMRVCKRKSLRLDDDYFLLHQPPEPRCNHTKGAFSYSSPKVWYDLPYALRSLTSVDAFKSALKTNLFRKAYRDDGKSYEFDFNSMDNEC